MLAALQSLIKSKQLAVYNLDLVPALWAGTYPYPDNYKNE